MREKLVAAALAILLMGGLPANAHSQLVDAEPRPNLSYKVSPKNITLSFNEELLDLGPRSNVITLTAQNRKIATGPAQIQGNQLVTKLNVKLRPGRYTTWWRALSADGHPISGRFNFTVTK